MIPQSHVRPHGTVTQLPTVGQRATRLAGSNTVGVGQTSTRLWIWQSSGLTVGHWVARLTRHRGKIVGQLVGTLIWCGHSGKKVVQIVAVVGAVSPQIGSSTLGHAGSTVSEQSGRTEQPALSEQIAAAVPPPPPTPTGAAAARLRSAIEPPRNSAWTWWDWVLETVSVAAGSTQS
jgi:hypothetical protein